ncbi:hypothetical protein [uncultured Tenacibaculum sp.]|uniref:hypothetical protein n=1 Tax=uncultured Tenacibaculum sp. TaxID=174713 RepID=UPI00262CC8FF|nr:hypothetical protein [uncultured Tenacibaculum sp.]
MRRILLLLFIVSIGCKNAETKKEIKSQGNIDTRPVFYVQDDCILFLKPLEKHLNEKLKDVEGIAEVDGDFNYYANQFYKEQKEQYKIYFVEQRLVALIDSKKDTLYIDRDKKELDYGVVLQQKDSVQILEGVNTDIDIKMALGIFNPEG